jgi:hypothetical protein
MPVAARIGVPVAEKLRLLRSRPGLADYEAQGEVGGAGDSDARGDLDVKMSLG